MRIELEGARLAKGSGLLSSIICWTVRTSQVNND